MGQECAQLRNVLRGVVCLVVSWCCGGPGLVRALIGRPLYPGALGAESATVRSVPGRDAMQQSPGSVSTAAINRITIEPALAIPWSPIIIITAITAPNSPDNFLHRCCGLV